MTVNEKMARWHDQHAQAFTGDEPWRKRQREFHQRCAAELRKRDERDRRNAFE